MRTNYAKIVATLGPSSDSYSNIESLVQAGMDVARLNFSHGSYLNFKEIAENVRKAAKKLKYNVGILQDLQGPKIRLGLLPKDGVRIKKEQKIVLSTSVNKYDIRKPLTFPVQYKQLHKDVKKGSRIFIDDGIIQVVVTKVTGHEIACIAKTDGIFFSNKGINAPDSNITAKPLTEKDKKDLKFGLNLDVEYIALSFVKSANDISSLRKTIKILQSRSSGKTQAIRPPKIIAKIERKEALDNIEEIIKESDGIMVARGDLGVEIRPELVPIVQKSIIKLCNKYGKPVITATQVLNSMIESPRPTRAEISDAANAIYDGTDAIMLSNETAVGKYPQRSVQILSRTISAVENELKKHSELLDKKISGTDARNANATCLSTCQLALDTKANHLVVYTKDGYTALQAMKHRVFISPIIISPSQKVLKELSLVWGINDVLQKSFSASQIEKNLDTVAVKLLLKEKIVKKGEKLVVVHNAKTKGSVSSLIV